MAKDPRPTRKDADKRQIIGISMTPERATDVKTEAARRGMSIRSLFEEMWQTYKKQQKV